MSIIGFIVFLMMDLFILGVFAFIYSGKDEYSEGMILGVHIPKDEAENEEVMGIRKAYKKYFKRFNLWNLLFGTSVCFLCFWNFTGFMIIWMIWLIEYVVMVYVFLYRYHRKMYDLKIRHNWIVGTNTHMIHVDTVVSSMSDKLPISHWFNLPAVIIIGITMLLPQLRRYFGENQLLWILPASILLMGILFWGVHLWMISRKNIVYSTNSSVNLTMNRMEKRTWSVLLLGATYMNLLGWGYLVIKIIRSQWLYSADSYIYIALQMLPAILIVLGVFTIKKKRKELLAMDTEPLLVDDDEYWKNGWYSNPKDPHLFVQDRMNSMNYSMNMAKPAAKIATGAMVIFVTVIIIVTYAMMISLENAKVIFQMDAGQVTIDAAMYDTNFNTNEIESVKIIDKLPEDDYTRTNGGATEKYLIGHFSGKEVGKCMLFLYRDYSPVLEVKLKDKTIYVNSKTKNEVQEWYRELTENIKDK